MISPISIPINYSHLPAFKRAHNPIPEELRVYKEKTGDFAFCQIDGLTCPSCGAEMLSQNTFDKISHRISSANPQECMEILRKNRRFMLPTKRSIFDKIVSLQEKEPDKSILEILNEIDAKENEQMLQSQMQILKRMADIARAAGDNKVVERQKSMFKKLKTYRSDLPKNEREIFDDILFSHENQLKKKKRPISPVRLISRIKDAGFEDENFTRQVISSIDTNKDCPEYKVYDFISSAIRHRSDIIENRKRQRPNQGVEQGMKDYLLSEEMKKLEQIRALSDSLPEEEASGIRGIIDKACEKIETQQSTVGRKVLMNEIRQLNISSPDVLGQITAIVDTKIKDSANYRAHILPTKYQQGIGNITYSFSRDNIIDKIREIMIEDSKLKRAIINIAESLPTSQAEEKYNEIINLLDYGQKCKEPEVTRNIAKAILLGSVANTDHFEAVKGESKGLDIITNYIAMHEDCNSRKRAKQPYLWFKENPKRAIYLKRHLKEVQQHINRGEINDIRYNDYTEQITDRVLRTTNGNVDLRTLTEV